MMSNSDHHRPLAQGQLTQTLDQSASVDPEQASKNQKHGKHPEAEQDYKIINPLQSPGVVIINCENSGDKKKIVVSSPNNSTTQDSKDKCMENGKDEHQNGVEDVRPKENTNVSKRSKDPRKTKIHNGNGLSCSTVDKGI